jgi:hypothetical protein
MRRYLLLFHPYQLVLLSLSQWTEIGLLNELPFSEPICDIVEKSLLLESEFLPRRKALKASSLFARGLLLALKGAARSTAHFSKWAYLFLFDAATRLVEFHSEEGLEVPYSKNKGKASEARSDEH